MSPEIISCIITNLVVIILFAITFFTLDKRRIAKENNKRDVGRALILCCVDECMKSIEILENQALLERYIVPKVDFNRNADDDPIITRTLNYPFTNEEIIMGYFGDGVLTKEDLGMYLALKKAHKDYVRMRITLFDATPPLSFQIEEYKKHLETAAHSIRERYNVNA